MKGEGARQKGGAKCRCDCIAPEPRLAAIVLLASFTPSIGSAVGTIMERLVFAGRGQNHGRERHRAKSKWP
jgi:hypothetical protein